VSTPGRPSFRLQVREEAGVQVLSLAGRLDREGLEPLVGEVRRLLEERRPKALRLELAGLEYLDSAGALALTLVEQEAAKAGLDCRLEGLDPKAAALKALIDPAALTRPPLIPSERRRPFLDQVGEAALAFWDDLREMVGFVGELTLALGRVLTRPRELRWGDVALYMERVGVDGLPIVGLIALLMGLIIAFMSSLQLASFGANIYVASLVALAMVRELGPIMTAVLVAGRSGSAFAAEIGTMKVNEEVEALVVMGYDPVMFLALPKVLAAAVVVPLLTLYADLLAILGGMLVGVLGLDLTVYSYVQQTARSLEVFDVISGLLKSLVFAVLIAVVGCQRGFGVRGGAQAVGRATTSAVVTALFLIIVTDSVFAILLHYLD